MADAARIADILVRSWQVAYAGQLPDEILARLSVRERQQFWERALCRPERAGQVNVVVDLGGGGLGGFASAGRDPAGDEPDGPVGQLRAIYLDPRHWGRGLGRQLHDHVLVALGADGCRRAELWVLRTNTRACRFYERAGWSADGVGKTECFWGFALDLIRYRKDLGPQRRPEPKEVICE